MLCPAMVCPRPKITIFLVGLFTMFPRFEVSICLLFFFLKLAFALPFPLIRSDSLERSFAPSFCGLLLRRAYGVNISNFCDYWSQYLQQQESCSILRTRSMTSSNPDPFYYRISYTNTILKITPRPRRISGTEKRVVINNARRFVRSEIRRSGDGPINQGSYIYPARITGVGLAFISMGNKLTWGETNNALFGLLNALYERGIYSEASFIVYDDSQGLRLQEEGSGSIFSLNPESVTNVTRNINVTVS